MSNGNLSLGAYGDVSLSGGSVSINARSKIIVQKSKHSYISIENELYNEANAVFENGSCRETFDAFTDDDPQNGVAEALAKKKKEEILLKFKSLNLFKALKGANAVAGTMLIDKLKGTGNVESKGSSSNTTSNDSNKELPTYNINGNYNEGDRVKVKLNGKEFPATVKPKKDGTVYAAVDDYGEFVKAGEESYKKAKPKEQLVGAVVADTSIQGALEVIKWMPMGARWFGEKTGLGDENTYKNNTECIERLTELQEGTHKLFKNISGDEKAFEGFSEIYQNALIVSGGISLLSGVAKGSIALLKSKKAKEFIDLLKGTKIASKTTDKIDDFEKWLKRIVKPNEGEVEKLSKIGRTIENVTNECNDIAEEVAKASKVADEVENSKITEGAAEAISVAKNSLSTLRNAIKNDEIILKLADGRTFKPQKIAMAIDSTDANNALKHTYGFNRVWDANPSIGDDIVEVVGKSNKEIAELYTEHHLRTLYNDNYIKELFQKHPEHFKELGVTEKEVITEMNKFRKMLNSAKEKARTAPDAVKKIAPDGSVSFEEKWSIENCAEVWAVRNSILSGVKVDNIMLRTVDNMKGGVFAPPCRNCQVTFEEWIKSGRIISD